MAKKYLPIGTQTFQEIQTRGDLYVDKTGYLHTLITAGRIYFLSRPRRFGKSLTISTLEAIFKGKRELFKGLYIDKTDYDWKTYPIIRLDLSQFNVRTKEGFVDELKAKLSSIAKEHGCEIDDDKSEGYMLSQLIEKLAKQSPTQKAVVLIDEYDKPIIEHIANLSVAEEMRNTLKSFYGILKSSDEYIRFVLITGVSKFSKTSIFSDLNHLNELSLHPRYAGLCGYTQEELENNFKDYIDDAAKDLSLSKVDLLEKIKYWYNGYRFSENGVKVYNPFSTLLFFDTHQFKAHWFETGTPTFLVDLIEQKQFEIEQAESYDIDTTLMSDYKLEDLQIIPLLFQTGYLTIQEYNETTRQYRLSYPNYEVRDAFLTAVFNRTSQLGDQLGVQHLWRLIQALQDRNIKGFIDHLTTFFAQIPYNIQIKQERYYQSLFYLIFALIGCKIDAEVHTNNGRIDAVIQTKTDIYIFEFKLVFSPTSPDALTQIANEALAQIDHKNYSQKYKNNPNPIHKIGIAFDGNTRNVGAIAQQ